MGFNLLAWRIFPRKPTRDRKYVYLPRSLQNSLFPPQPRSMIVSTQLGAGPQECAWQRAVTEVERHRLVAEQESDGTEVVVVARVRKDSLSR